LPELHTRQIQPPKSIFRTRIAETGQLPDAACLKETDRFNRRNNPLPVRRDGAYGRRPHAYV
jgi:hypothetical protein